MADHTGSQDSSDNESGGHYSGSQDQSVREQDRFLPIANVSRIMKRALPANGKISKEAKETVQECVSEFISFITGEAADKCQREKRKTVNGDDLLWAMGTLGFEDYLEPLKVYLQKYRETEGERGAGVKQGEQQVGSTNSSVSTGMAGSMQMMQRQPQGYAYPGMPANMMYGQQMMAPYHMDGGGGGGGSSGGNLKGQHQ